MGIAPQKTVFGCGYVGLVTGACLADVGHQVLCVDVDTQRVNQLNAGEIPIYEPGLQEMVQRNRQEGLLNFSADLKEAVVHGELLFIAVGTPSDAQGAANLRYVFDVADAIAAYMDGYKVVVSKSTVPVGTGQQIEERIQQGLLARKSPFGFDVCSNPEFLKEGSAIEDFTRAARVVVGTDSDRVKQLMRECYGSYNRNRNKLIFMQRNAAELTKYAANAMLATKISFMNEMANLAEHLDADIEQVRQGIGSDPRIGYDFIYPGCGYGSSCFPKNIKALLHTAEACGYPAQLLNSVHQVNEQQKCSLFNKLDHVFAGHWQGKKIALWGLAFKPNTDDMRESPSRALMEQIWQAGGQVQAYDPVAMEECQRIYGSRNDLSLCDQRDACLDNADALVICTE